MSHGIFLAETAISAIDAGRLLYRGIAIEDIFEHGEFAEIVWLLWQGRLPTSAQLAELEDGLAAAWPMPRDLVIRMRAFPPATPMTTVLREAVATLSLTPGPAIAVADLPTEAIRILGMLPAVAAQWHHIAAGRPHFAPRVEGSLATRFLHAVRGDAPTEAEARALDRALILYAEHGLAASTLAARLVAATDAPLSAAVIAALCAVGGPLHGGVCHAVWRLLDSIKAPNEAPRAVDTLLRAGQRPPGFGHGAYDGPDPRAALFRRLAAAPGRGGWLKTADAVAETVVTRTGLLPAGDFYATAFLHGLGLPLELAAVVFCLGRAAGWIAHSLEQQADNRMVRPVARPIGPGRTAWTPRRSRHTVV